MNYIFVNINNYNNIINDNGIYFAKLYYDKYIDAYKLEQPYEYKMDKISNLNEIKFSFFLPLV